MKRSTGSAVHAGLRGVEKHEVVNLAGTHPLKHRARLAEERTLTAGENPASPTIVVARTPLPYGLRYNVAGSAQSASCAVVTRVIVVRVHAPQPPLEVTREQVEHSVLSD